MIDVIEKNDCTGCKMCADICPCNAISFIKDKYGFEYPSVDYKKCISCGICVEKCPGMHRFYNEKCGNPRVYAAWLKEKEMRLYSTSGGLYYAFAKEFLNEGGVVVACRFTNDWKHAEHVVVEDEKELLPTVRSKYFQSETAGIYKKVREKIDAGKNVLFCGTPCQCAAIRRYLGEKCNQLVTMDFICRGNNSQKAYEAFIEELEIRYNSSVKSVQFKNKRNGWTSLGVLVEFENGQEYYDTRKNSYWTLGYIKDNLYMRPVCHNCKYRTIPRISDFTVGDFWGIKNVSQEDMFNGISVLFANTKYANEVVKKMRNILQLEEHSLEDAIKGNPCILSSPMEGKMKENFFALLEEKSFSEAVAACCGRLQ